MKKKKRKKKKKGGKGGKILILDGREAGAGAGAGVVPMGDSVRMRGSS
jgi:hypothetical protein